MITRNFNLYLNAGHSVPLVINVNQYDSGEQWVFTLYNSDGTQYTPSTGAIVGIKSDGLGIINSGSVVDGNVVINETQQMTAAVGKAVFELLIDSQTHGTANFIVLVEEKPGNNADLSESDLSLLQEAIDATSPLPTGGSVGQVLTKTASGSAWSDAGTPTQEQVADAVSDWADEHITVETGVVIDTSLSVAGAAADSKKVGDEITDLKSAIGNLNNLDTDIKTDLVSAINEVMGSGGSGVPTSVRQALQTLLENALYNGDGLTDEKAIIASWATEVTDLIINQSSIAIVGDDTYQLTATTIPSGALVSWYSSDANVASVSQTGLVKGVGNGNCVITASSGDMRAMCSVGVSGFVMYSVTNSLTKVSTDNNATEVARGSEYSANLTVFEGYDLDSVTVTMGGTDITSTAYSDGVVSIASVTGDLVITAVATYTPVAQTVTFASVKDSSYEGRRFAGAELEPTGAYATACISYYLSVLPGSTFSVSGMGLHNVSSTDVVFYNYAKDAVVGTGNFAYGSWSFTVPEGAYWVRFNMKTDDAYTVTYTPYEI